MQRVISFLSVLIIISSCSNHSPKELKGNQILSPVDSLRETILGSWGGIDQKIPVFEIRSDSIYYFNISKAFPDKIINGDLVINKPEGQAFFREIHVIKDTLFFKTEMGGVITGYRIKK